VGTLSGVDILAHTLRTELPGGAIHEASGPVFLLIDILAGMTLVTATWLVRSAWTLVVLILLIPVAAFSLSLSVYSTFTYFASFAPVLLGVFMHGLIEHIVHHQQMARELREYRAGGRDHGSQHHDLGKLDE
jgi:hypothetical protein